MKPYLIIFSLAIFSVLFMGQSDEEIWYYTYPNGTPVMSMDTVESPLTSYVNGYLRFRAPSQKTFARSRDLDFTEFIGDDSLSIFIRVRQNLPRVPSQRVMGKYNGTAGSWMLGFGANYGANYWEIYCNGWDSIKNIGATDSAMHDILITWRRADSTWHYFFDGVEEWSRKKIWTPSNNIVAFTVGNGGATANNADPSTAPVDSYCNITVDSIAIHSYENNVDSAGAWGMNEGAGDWAYDSYTYLTLDRTHPDNSYGASHLNLGAMVTTKDSSNKNVWVVDGFKSDYVSNTDSVGSGLTMIQPDFPYFAENYQLGLVVWNDGLVSSGHSTRVNTSKDDYNGGGDSVAYIAYWSGLTWSKIGTATAFNTNVTQVGMWDDNLVAVGDFTNVEGKAQNDRVVIWNSDLAQWDSLRSGLNNAAVCLTTHNTALIVGGGFTTAGGVTVNKVASWNGTAWSALGSTDIGNVSALESWNGVLYAGTSTGLWFYTGSAWTQISGVDAEVLCLQPYRNELWIGNSEADIYSYNGSAVTNWGYTEGNEGDIIEMCVTPDGKDLYIIGSFYRMIYNNRNTVSKHILRFNGSNYSAVVYGGIDLRPEDLVIWLGALYVNGDLFSAAGKEYSNIFKITLP